MNEGDLAALVRQQVEQVLAACPACAVRAEHQRAGLDARKRFTRRQLEVLAMLAEGLTNNQIGRRLHLDTETVKSHLRSVFAKLGARSRAGAVALALRAGVIE